MSSLLPELYHCAGEISGVFNAVVGVTAVCVPRIATTLPWQVLKITEKRGKKITQTALFTRTTLPPLGPILPGCQAAKTMILIEISCFSQRIESPNRLIAKCIYQYLVLSANYVGKEVINAIPC